MSTNPDLCPICGGDNGCALRRNKPIEQCWCTKAVFTEAMFREIPEEKRRQSCICRPCVDRIGSASGQEADRKNG